MALRLVTTLAFLAASVELVLAQGELALASITQQCILLLLPACLRILSGMPFRKYSPVESSPTFQAETVLMPGAAQMDIMAANSAVGDLLKVI